MDPMDIIGKTKEDASLPKATMTKIIKEMLPPDVRVARDTQDLLIDCCVCKNIFFLKVQFFNRFWLFLAQKNSFQNPV
ncbi:putative transcription factor Hap3/NF-YB family [Helianthus annuus]|nr:putative transcription factor Hap3/NF-YB family [Helianthus annuus]